MYSSRFKQHYKQETQEPVRKPAEIFEDVGNLRQAPKEDDWRKPQSHYDNIIQHNRF